MIAILASVPGKLKTLLDRLTATRAANLDKLDANVSTRAAAATALTNAVWTDARAGRLDLLSFKSVQTGYVSGSIAASSGEDLKYIDVTLATPLTDYTKAFVIVQGSWGHSTTGDPFAVPSARMTSNATLRVSSGFSSTGSPKIRYYVVELA